MRRGQSIAAVSKSSKDPRSSRLSFSIPLFYDAFERTIAQLRATANGSLARGVKATANIKRATCLLTNSRILAPFPLEAAWAKPDAKVFWRRFLHKAHLASRTLQKPWHSWGSMIPMSKTLLALTIFERLSRRMLATHREPRGRALAPPMTTRFHIATLSTLPACQASTYELLVGMFCDLWLARTCYVRRHRLIRIMHPCNVDRLIFLVLMLGLSSLFIVHWDVDCNGYWLLIPDIRQTLTMAGLISSMGIALLPPPQRQQAKYLEG